MLDATHDKKPAISLLLFIAVVLLLVFSPYSYHALELLVCWLFFGLVFVSLALVLLGARSHVTRENPLSTGRATCRDWHRQFRSVLPNFI
jgi:hypothetical protein